ncbi:MAG: Zn-dependent alcohol dehydrogenase [Firmicutes bacterium]|nr:Zn-dependent alcohol dehydrogenase [Bacillota bacterium]
MNLMYYLGVKLTKNIGDGALKALIKTKSGVGNVELLDVPEPQCTESGVKIEIKWAGICGTDLHIYYDLFRNVPPVTLCHEFSGIVTEVGTQVSKVKPGDRVVVLGSTMVRCGTCEHCKTGEYIFCATRMGMGHGGNGGFTRYVVVREDMVYKLADNVTLEIGALAEPFACAVHAIEDTTKINVGDIVYLSGPGPIGLLCLALLRAHGCKVIIAGTDQDQLRLEIAKELGADVIVNVSKENPVDVVNRETKDQGADVVIECSGAEPSIATCLQVVKKLGKYIQLGIAGKKVSLDYDTLFYKQIQIYGSNSHNYRSWERVMRIFEQGKVDLNPVITHKMPLSKWREAFDLCEAKTCSKVLLYYDE